MERESLPLLLTSSSSLSSSSSSVGSATVSVRSVLSGQQTSEGGGARVCGRTVAGGSLMKASTSSCASTYREEVEHLTAILQLVMVSKRAEGFLKCVKNKNKKTYQTYGSSYSQEDGYE